MRMLTQTCPFMTSPPPWSPFSIRLFLLLEALSPLVTKVAANHVARLPEHLLAGAEEAAPALIPPQLAHCRLQRPRHLNTATRPATLSMRAGAGDSPHAQSSPASAMFHRASLAHAGGVYLLQQCGPVHIRTGALLGQSAPQLRLPLHRLGHRLPQLPQRRAVHHTALALRLHTPHLRVTPPLQPSMAPGQKQEIGACAPRIGRSTWAASGSHTATRPWEWGLTSSRSSSPLVTWPSRLAPTTRRTACSHCLQHPHSRHQCLPGADIPRGGPRSLVPRRRSLAVQPHRASPAGSLLCWPVVRVVRGGGLPVLLQVVL